MTGGEHGLLALRERKLVVDAVWLASLLLLLLAIALPWYHGLLELDLAPVTWVLLGYGAAHLVVTLAADRLRDRRWLLRCAFLLQIAAVLMLGVIWCLLGGVQTPMLLLAFVLPVVASGMLALRWWPYVLAAFAIVVAWSAAVLTSPGLRWYLARLAPSLEWLTSMPAVTVHGAFPSLELEPAFVLVMLELFAVLALAAAVTTDSLAGMQHRLAARLDSSGAAVREARSLAQQMVRASTRPAALVDQSTHRVVEASESLMRQFLLDPSELPDRTLSEMLGMPYPEALHAAIARGGEVPHAVCRIGGETRLVGISAYPVEHAGVRYSHVSLTDVSHVHHLEGGLDIVELPCVMLDANRRILHLNRAARTVFGDVPRGHPASPALEPSGAPARWWDPGPRRSHRREIRIGETAYRADLAVGDLPAQTGGLVVITLQPSGPKS